jgi:hypothetical protein
MTVPVVQAATPTITRTISPIMPQTAP